jgi:hypothetical protein
MALASRDAAGASGRVSSRAGACYLRTVFESINNKKKKAGAKPALSILGD